MFMCSDWRVSDSVCQTLRTCFISEAQWLTGIDEMKRLVCMYVCMYVWMDGWMQVWMHGCMYVRMYGWMDACMDVCMYVWR
jgi:predicted RNase H-like nuclease